MGHPDEVPAELLSRHLQELGQHRIPESAFCARGLHRLDALDRIDLVGGVLPMGLLDVGEERTQDTTREPHQCRIRGKHEQEHAGQLQRVHGHQCDAPRGLQRRERSAHAVLHQEQAHLSRAVQPALDVARATRMEITHRQRQQPPREEVQHRAVDAHRQMAQQVLLDQVRRQHQDRSHAQRTQHQRQQCDIAIDDDLVDDELREHRHQQSEHAYHQRQPAHECPRSAMARQEGPQPRQRGRVLGCLLEGLGVVEQRGVTRPLLEELGPGHAAASVGWIRHPHRIRPHRIQHDPVVAFPVADGRQREVVEMSARGLHGSRCQSQFGGRSAEGAQTGAVVGRVAQRPQPGQGHLAAEVPAHHREARHAAVHLVDLRDEGKRPPQRGTATEESILREGFVAIARFTGTCGLVGDQRLGGERFLPEIEGQPGGIGALVLRKAFPQQPVELGVFPPQFLHVRRFEAEEFARRNRHHGRGAGGPVQDRQFAEVIARAIERAVHLGTLRATEGPGPTRPQDEHRPGRVAFADEDLVLCRRARSKAGHQRVQRRRGQAPEVRELVEESVQRAPATEQFEGLADAGIGFDQSEEVFTAQPQRLDGGTGPDAGVPRTAVEQCSLAELIPRHQPVQRDLLGSRDLPEHSSPAGHQHVEGVRRFALSDQIIPEVEPDLVEEVPHPRVVLLRHEPDQRAASQDFFAFRIHSTGSSSRAIHRMCCVTKLRK